MVSTGISSRRGFALIELLCLILIAGLLAGILGGYASRLRDKAFVLTDINNFRQILRASALYNTENDDRMAHPTWGGDLTGPDGWAYLTSGLNRVVPGALTRSPSSCAGVDTNSPQFTNQLAYFKVGQVTRYLDEVRTAWCPKDSATRGSGGLRTRWLARPVKVTSYTWNGSIGGYDGNPSDLNGRTYKVSDFRPGDYQMWEADDTDSFNFIDAASNPYNGTELSTRRHAGS